MQEKMNISRSFLFLIYFIFGFFTTTSARCLNWCSKNGICTDPGEAGYCICDTGYTGADCSKRICPKAYDPLTIGHNESRRTLRLAIGRESGPLNGKLKLQFHDDVVTLESDPSVVYLNDCSKAFSSFKGISKATCKAEQEWSSEALSYSYLVTIHEWSLYPQENNIFFHNGNPDINEFSCDVSLLDELTIDKPYCEITDVVNSNLPEYVECGNHGKCDFKSGVCICQHGFHGDACHDTSDSQDELAAVHDGPFFTGTVIKGLAIRSSSNEFNLLELGHSQDILYSNNTVTRIRGDGLLEHHGESKLFGQMTISSPQRNQNALLSLSYNEKLASANLESTTMIDSTAISSSDYHLKLHTLMPHVLPDQENIKYVSKSVLNITGLGDIQTSGSLSVGSGKFVVSDGVMTTQSLNVQNSLDVHGTAVIEDSLTIGSGFALTPEGMTIDTSRHTGALLELRSSQKQFDGAYLEINSLTSGQTPANSSMIRTSVDGFTTFDLKTNGHLIVNGIQMKSGGFVISSGGMNIESGGLVVKGGITMESGVLDLSKNNMKLSSITLENHDSNSHILQIDNYNSHFIGPVISINQNNPSTSTLHENYIIMETKKNQKTIFQLDSDGNIESNGSMKLKNKLILENNLHINGMISFTPYQIIADDEITLPSNHVFIEILDDHKESKNIIFLPILNIVSGQMMILRNLDMNTIYLTYYQTTSTHQDNSQRYKIKIPSNVSILLIYNGYDWIDIQSLSTSIEKLKNIQELTFQNDVNVGNITMTTGGYRMYGLNKGEVLVGGIGGTIKGRKGLIYSNGILSTQGLKVEILESDIDGNMKTISNIILSQAMLSNATITATSIRIPKLLSGIAYFTQKGELRSSSSVHLTEEGHLEITDLYNSINFHNNSLQNISSLSCQTIENVEIAKFDKLYLRTSTPADTSTSTSSMKEDTVRLLSVGYDGKVQDIPIHMNINTNEVYIDKLHLHEQLSDINYHHHQIINATLNHGDIRDMNSISTKNLQILLNSTELRPQTLVIIDHNGYISSDTSSNVNPIHASNLEVQDINIVSTQSPVTDSMTLLGTTTSKIIAGKDLTYSNGELHAPKISVNTLHTSELYLPTASSSGTSTIVSVDPTTGKLHSTSQVKLEEIQTQTLNVNGQTKLHGDVQLTGLSNTILSVNQEGKIISGNDARLQSIVSQQGTFTSLILNHHEDNKGGIGGGGVLQADPITGLVTTSTTMTMNSIETSTLSSHRISVNELFLQNYLNSTLLTIDSNGKLQSSSEFIGESITVKHGNIKNILTEKLTLSSLATSSSTSTSTTGGTSSSLLGTNLHGEIIPLEHGKLNTLEVNTLEISENLVMPSTIQFRDRTSTGTSTTTSGDSILVADKNGMARLSDNADISVNSLHVNENIHVDGEITAKSLKLLNSHRSMMEDTTSSSNAHHILSISSTGMIEPLANLKLHSLDLLTSLNSSFGKFHNLEISNLPLNQPLVLIDSGKVSTSSDLTINLIKSKKIESITGEFDQLILHPSSSSSSSSGILKIDSNGLIAVTDRLDIPTSTISSKLDVLGDTHLHSLYLQPMEMKTSTSTLSSRNQNIFLQMNPQTGLVTGASDNLFMTTLNTETLQTQHISTHHLHLQPSTPLIQQNSLLMMTPNGDISSIHPTEKYSIGQLDISHAIISNLSFNNLTETTSYDHDMDGILSITSSGQVKLTKKSSLLSLTSDVISVKNINLHETIRLNPQTLKSSSSSLSNKKGIILTMNSDTNELSLNSHAEISILDSESLNTDRMSITSSLQLPFIPNSILGTNSEGNIIKSDDLSVKMNKLQTNSHYTDYMEVKKMKFSDISSSSGVGTSSGGGSATSRLVGVKSDGYFETISDITISSIISESMEVNKKMKTRSLILSELNPGILRIDEQGGAVTSTTHLSHLDDIKTKNLEVSSTLLVSDLIFMNPIGSMMMMGVLTVDPTTGKLHSTSQVKLEEIQTQTLNVNGQTKLHGDVQLTGLSNTILSVNQEGKIISGNDISLGDITTKSLKNKGKLSTTEIEIQSLTTEGVVITSSTGHLTSTSDLKLNNIHSNNLYIHGESQIASLSVRSLKLLRSSTSTSSPSSTSSSSFSGDGDEDEILFITPTGSIISNNKFHNLHALNSKITNLIVSNQLITKSIQLELSTPPEFDYSVLTTNRQGLIGFSSNLQIQQLSVSKNILTKELDVEILKIPNLPLMTLLMNDRNGHITSSNPYISITTDGIIKIRELDVELLKEDLNLNKKKLSHGIIAKSEIMETDIFLSTESKRGFDDSFLAVVDQQSGLLGQSSRISVTKSGAMKINGLHPAIEDGYIQIHSAELHSPHLIQARVDAKDLKSSNLVVMGTSDLNGNVYVDGSITVRGSVIGSGPYIDTSDSRFKTNITHLDNSLDIVKKMNGVSYDNRVDDFPSYNFDNSRQIGWIADDVAELVPELVYTDDKGYRHIAYSRSVALLGEAIKELSTECDAKTKVLEDKIQQQAEEIKELRDLVHELLIEMKKKTIPSSSSSS